VRRLVGLWVGLCFDFVRFLGIFYGYGYFVEVDYLSWFFVLWW